jgi:hypothetical protein
MSIQWLETDACCSVTALEVASAAPSCPAAQPRRSRTDDVKRIDGIDLRQFSKPVTVAQLHRSRCSELPIACGVYVVFRPRASVPMFLPKSSAGWFKGKDPSYPADVVKAKWVARATVVYVGKTVSKKGLRGRVRALADFAFGKPVGHRGGRPLWHLADWEQLQVLWREYPAARVDAMETSLIATFRGVHDARPFANMVK